MLQMRGADGLSNKSQPAFYIEVNCKVATPFAWCHQTNKISWRVSITEKSLIDIAREMNILLLFLPMERFGNPPYQGIYNRSLQDLSAYSCY